MSNNVLLCKEVDQAVLKDVLGRFGLAIVLVQDNREIPGSFWGDCEAGLVDNNLYIRGDTPLHSALHESCHYICMDATRRSGLHTNAGGDYDEENAVNYLQILLADFFSECGRDRMMQDMDTWGYSYRLGSARAWFEEDAEDAMKWLLDKKITAGNNQVTWQVRN
ncbi:MAG: hypothetical protein OEX00_02395 [Gammaproteobacteria bacterium]|nr:hypothetical protein [Gammaproteobacteria bacterium]MDH5691679.1 hypothetical protein [Gammaproteobacteria bacterium]